MVVLKGKLDLRLKCLMQQPIVCPVMNELYMVDVVMYQLKIGHGSCLEIYLDVVGLCRRVGDFLVVNWLCMVIHSKVIGQCMVIFSKVIGLCMMIYLLVIGLCMMIRDRASHGDQLPHRALHGELHPDRALRGGECSASWSSRSTS
jgi:hypothetical protein